MRAMIGDFMRKKIVYALFFLHLFIVFLYFNLPLFLIRTSHCDASVDLNVSSHWLKIKAVTLWHLTYNVDCCVIKLTRNPFKCTTNTVSFHPIFIVTLFNWSTIPEFVNFLGVDEHTTSFYSFLVHFESPVRIK